VRILLIAADGTLRATLVVALRGAGHEALVTKATAMARGQPEEPDEVLIIAGEISGCLDLLDRVRDGRYKAPAVVISGPPVFNEWERLRRCRTTWISNVDFDAVIFATHVGEPDFPLIRESPTTPVGPPRKRSGVQRLATLSEGAEVVMSARVASGEPLTAPIPRAEATIPSDVLQDASSARGSAPSVRRTSSEESGGAAAVTASRRGTSASAYCDHQGRWRSHGREEFARAIEGTPRTVVAEHLGISEPMVSMLVNGRRQPSLENAVSIQRVFHVDPGAWLVAPTNNVRSA
jgi:hypothetical protein